MAFEGNYVEGVTTVENIVQSLATALTSQPSHSWTAVSSSQDNAILSTEITVSDGTNTAKKTFYLRIRRPENVLNYILMQIGTRLNGDELETGYRGEEVRFAWYRKPEEVYAGEWLPIQYWLSFSKNFCNIVLQGDPSPDTVPYNHYLISYAYIGSLESYEGGDLDVDYNFGITCGSDIFPELAKTYGDRTGCGNTDIIMVGTRTGTPYQAHNVAYQCESIHTDKNYIGSSNWTHKYHASPITVTHAYDRERGKLQGVLIMDRSAAFHLDEFKENEGEADEKTYKIFSLNAPYSFINNGANPLYSLVIRKA